MPNLDLKNIRRVIYGTDGDTWSFASGKITLSIWKQIVTAVGAPVSNLILESQLRPAIAFSIQSVNNES